MNKFIVFKLGDDVIEKASVSTKIIELELIREHLAKKHNVNISNICVEYTVEQNDLSFLVVDSYGILSYHDIPNYSIKGIRMVSKITEENINIFLDSFNKNKIEDFFEFTL